MPYVYRTITDEKVKSVTKKACELFPDDYQAADYFCTELDPTYRDKKTGSWFTKWIHGLNKIDHRPIFNSALSCVMEYRKTLTKGTKRKAKSDE